MSILEQDDLIMVSNIKRKANIVDGVDACQTKLAVSQAGENPARERVNYPPGT